MHTEPLPPCPYAKSQRHNLCAVMPESDSNPILLFCSYCGMTVRQSVLLPEPLDNLDAADIERIARQ